MLSFGLSPGVWILYADVSEHCLFHLHRHVGECNAPTCQRRCSCQVVIKLDLSGQNFEEYSNIEFHKNPSSGSWVVACGRTDLMKLRVAFLNFAYEPKKHKTFYSFGCAGVYSYICLSVCLHTHTHRPYLYSTIVLITCRIVWLCALFNYGSKLYCGFHNDTRKYCLHSSNYVYWLIMHSGNTRIIWSVCR
jgi:hypothetical protein